MQQTQNIPKYHHYVPRSFFKPWGNSSKEIIVYERKAGIVLPPYLASTKSICVKKGLYSYTDDVELRQRNLIEQNLLSIVDSNGALMLQKLNQLEGSVNVSDQERYHFAVFINSLRIRTPEAFAHYSSKAETLLREQLARDDPRLEEKDIEEILDGQTLLQWVEKNNSKILKNFGHELLAKFIVDDRFVNRVMNMHWIVLKRVAQEVNLLTSDRPLVLLGNLQNQTLGFAIAISTERVFVATSAPRSINKVLELPPNIFIKQMNISTIQQAERFAYASNRGHSIDFFRNRLCMHHRILPWTDSKT